MGLFSRNKKEKEVTKNESQVQNHDENTWVCPKCQTTNAKTSRSCKDCGYYR